MLFWIEGTPFRFKDGFGHHSETVLRFPGQYMQ